MGERCDVCLKETDNGLTCEDCAPDIVEVVAATESRTVAAVVAMLRARANASTGPTKSALLVALRDLEGNAWRAYLTEGGDRG